MTVSEHTGAVHLRSAISRYFAGLLLLAGLVLARPALALQGTLGAHDPSTIVKDGNTYWTFTTGQGITSLYSTDLVKWTAGARPVFQNNVYPSWINTRVPGFTGNFWAPECIFMNGKYYLYYSCSSFGSRVSAIGLVTNTTLDPNNPAYRWVDEGEVISTNGGSSVNAIDPAVFKDSNGDVWFTYGSYFGGLRTTQLNPSTGKVINTSNQFAVANNDPEAACLTKNGNYYYLFINRGACCQGSNSTYYILVGRSTSPTGPFLDQNGVSLNNGGGTVVLNASGRYVGPGHAGLLEEGGVTYFSHHYYDFDDNGAPKLGLAKLTWSAAGWPVVSRDWVTPGRYEIAGANGLVWDAWGCTGVSGQTIAQGTRAGLDCQKWDFATLGDGEYKITNALGGLAASVAGCSAANGALLQLGTYTFTGCKQFRLERANNGTMVIASLNGNRVVEVPNNSATVGQQLGLYDYNGSAGQRWTLTNTALNTAASQPLPGASIYPVPTAGRFTVDLGPQPRAEAVTVEIFNLQGQRVHRQTFASRPTTAVDAALVPGLYLVQVRQGQGLLSQKITVQ
ncbi:family 43 glycosylhydrolase [Hymenobacter sp. ASUV-10]|uniref:Family 43 glycosylhydrolase n=1 Tax=Hymenobacter aranciens TaxID=3063996 RepID=A0ABT9B4Y0_9BACT|nr:family 43 glycosylhydrolase [Hymenobacter sp. ASUV-10]MDO7873304.1 family 43 glycosylhydrolase [Hymenobacter sp. ASUV-10]